MTLLKKNISKKQVINLILQSLVIMIGTFIMAFGYIVFLSPNNIVPGGFTGVARIIHDLLAQVGFDYISVSLWYIILNIFLYIYAVKILGFEFGIRAGVGIFSYSMFTSLLENWNLISSIITKLQTESSIIGGGKWFYWWK